MMEIPKKMERLIDRISDGVYFVDTNRQVIFWSKPAERLTGYTAEEVVGKCCKDNILMHVDKTGRLICLDSCPLVDTINTGKENEAEVFLHHKEGHRVPVTVRSIPIEDEEGTIVGAMETFTSNSPRVDALGTAKILQNIALMDIETGAANRQYTEMTLKAWLYAKRKTKWSFGVLAISVDRAGKLRALYGEESEAKLLKMVAKTLLNTAKTYDVVGRWEAGLFIALVANVTENGLGVAADTFRALVSQSSLGEESILRVTVCVGGTLAEKTDDIADVIHRAKENLLRSQRVGENNTTIL